MVLALGVLTLLAFSNSFQAGFVLDNKGLLLDPRIREVTPDNIDLILRHTYWWPTGEAGLYRPFTTLSYLFNYAVLGDGEQSGGYHLINLILHLCNVLLAYVLALRLTRRLWPSAFIAAMWAVHPASTEAVTNIIGRADLLASFAVLSAFLMYLKSAEATGWSRAAWLTGLATATTIGVFSKESAVAIFAVIVVYELVWWKEHRRPQALLYGCIATLLPIAAMLYQRSVVLAASARAEFPFTDNPMVGADWWTRVVTAIQVMARYLSLTIWPAKLSCDYSYNQIPLAHGAADTWLTCTFVLGAAIGAVLLYRRNRTCFFLLCFAFLNFAPASNLFFPIGTMMADRLLYFPSLGLLACLALAIYAIAGGPKMAFLPPLVLCLITTAFAVRTWIRNSDWQTDLTIATADVRTSPNSFKLHRLLAESLFQSDPSHSNIDQVIEEQAKSLKLLDDVPAALSRPEPYRLAGYYYLLKGEQLRKQGLAQSAAAYQSARQNLSRSLTIEQAARPLRSQGDSQAYFLLSVVYLRLGDPAKAYDAAVNARALDPLNAQVHRQMSEILLQERRNEESDIATMQANAISYLQEGRWREAAELSDRVTVLNSKDYPSAYYLNAVANLRLHNLDVAEKSAREAVRLEQHKPRTSYVLGLILAEKQNFQAAAELLNQYLAALPDAPDAATVRKQLAVIESSAQKSPISRRK